VRLIFTKFLTARVHLREGKISSLSFLSARRSSRKICSPMSYFSLRFSLFAARSATLFRGHFFFPSGGPCSTSAWGSGRRLRRSPYSSPAQPLLLHDHLSFPATVSGRLFFPLCALQFFPMPHVPLPSSSFRTCAGALRWLGLCSSMATSRRSACPSTRSRPSLARCARAPQVAPPTLPSARRSSSAGYKLLLKLALGARP
jgi:hypothetical protein